MTNSEQIRHGNSDVARGVVLKSHALYGTYAKGWVPVPQFFGDALHTVWHATTKFCMIKLVKRKIFRVLITPRLCPIFVTQMLTHQLFVITNFLVSIRVYFRFCDHCVLHWRGTSLFLLYVKHFLQLHAAWKSVDLRDCVVPPITNRKSIIRRLRWIRAGENLAFLIKNCF